MIVEPGSGPKVAAAPSEDVQYLLARARQVDPGCEEDAIRGYFHEIAGAEEMLDSLDLEETPLNITFSVSWKGCLDNDTN